MDFKKKKKVTLYDNLYKDTSNYKCTYYILLKRYLVTINLLPRYNCNTIS